MDAPALGRCDFCLNVADVHRSFEFYGALGFRQVEGDLAENWVVMSHRGFRIGLYSGFIESWLINFRGADVESVARFAEAKGMNIKIPYKSAEKGGGNLTVLDPDGYIIFFDTHHTELSLPLKLEAYLAEEQQGPLGIGIGHVVLFVKDVHEAESFYTSLGFQRERDVLTYGNLRLILKEDDQRGMYLLFRQSDRTGSLEDPDGNRVDFEKKG